MILFYAKPFNKKMHKQAWDFSILSINDMQTKQISNAKRSNNRNDLLYLSFTLKISIFPEAYIWWWIVFVVWLTDERRLVLFPAWTIVRDPHHRESPTRRQQDMNCAEPEFRLSWIKLCSDDNHYTTAPQLSQTSMVKLLLRK